MQTLPEVIEKDDLHRIEVTRLRLEKFQAQHALIERELKVAADADAAVVAEMSEKYSMTPTSEIDFSTGKIVRR